KPEATRAIVPYQLFGGICGMGRAAFRHGALNRERAQTETVIVMTELGDVGRKATGVAALALLIGIAPACIGSSSLASLGVFSDLMAKGQTAMQAADEKMHQNRADAAYVIVRRHMNEIDAAIAKVERDARIADGDKAKTIHALREYRTVFEDASAK